MQKVVGNAVENDDEDVMVEFVVLEVDGEPRWTGSGFAPVVPSRSLRMFRG